MRISAVYNVVFMVRKWPVGTEFHAHLECAHWFEILKGHSISLYEVLDGQALISTRPECDRKCINPTNY